MKRRRHHTTNKGHAIQRIRGAAKSASHELAKAGLRHSAHALKVIGGATAAIGKHTPGNWAADMGAGMRAAPLSGHHARRKRAKKATTHRKAHRGHRKGAKRRGGLSKLSAKQLRAFRKMIAARRRKSTGRRTTHHKRRAARRR